MSEGQPLGMLIITGHLNMKYFMLSESTLLTFETIVHVSMDLSGPILPVQVPTSKQAVLEEMLHLQ